MICKNKIWLRLIFIKWTLLAWKNWRLNSNIYTYRMPSRIRKSKVLGTSHRSCRHNWHDMNPFDDEVVLCVCWRLLQVVKVILVQGKWKLFVEICVLHEGRHKRYLLAGRRCFGVGRFVAVMLNFVEGVFIVYSGRIYSSPHSSKTTTTFLHHVRHRHRHRYECISQTLDI